MPLLRAHNIAVSLDGFMAGPDQSLEDPMGRGGQALHQWAFATASFHRMIGRPGGETGPDDDLWRRGTAGIGATVMGRNMFSPGRGEWDPEWRGWWGDEPPFHHPVFVLTSHPRDPLVVGETTFHFVTDGVAAARERALEAAGGLDVRVGGGAQVLRACLQAGLLDELHLALVPVLLGGGERLLDDVTAGCAVDGYRVVSVQPSAGVVHVDLARMPH
ncbi:MAG: dihydrofolate reductase family protein [Mycobacteriales bacterium]